MQLSALLFKNKWTKSKAPHPVEDAKPKEKQSIAFIDQSSANMKPPDRTSKASSKVGLKDMMKSYFADMRKCGVPKSERRTSVAYAMAFLRTNIALADDEQATLMDFDDNEETPVAIAVSDGSNPVIISDLENDQRTTVVATSTSGQDVNISRARPADISSSPSNSSSMSSGEKEDQDPYPITYTNGSRTHTIDVRNGIRFHHSMRLPIPDGNTSGPCGPPFNHFPQEPRTRSRGLRRENAFCHKSHYEIFWYPGFGDYNKPPMSVEEALPTRYFIPSNESASISAVVSSSPNPDAFPGDEITTIHSTTPINASTSPFVSRKRARDNENSGDNSDGAPPHRRPRPI